MPSDQRPKRPSDFQPARLRLARELAGLSQIELARRTGLTSPAISQFESGASRPGADTWPTLATELGVPAEFFHLPLSEVHEGFFRSLRRTAITERRRARAIAHVARDVAHRLVDQSLIPEYRPLGLNVALGDDAEVVEKAAAEVRRAWRIRRGPAPNTVELLEAHGVLVTRLSLASADVDAFSLPFSDRPVVVLSANKNDRARSRFDAAHELGHLVMHGESVWGLPIVEAQAQQFAAAFLMPRQDIRSELPRFANWPLLFELKRKWQVSLAALLMRAKTLGVMTQASYLAAIKSAAMRGWRRVEPVPLGEPEQPQLLPRLVSKYRQRVDPPQLPDQVLSALAVSAG